MSEPHVAAATSMLRDVIREFVHRELFAAEQNASTKLEVDAALAAAQVRAKDSGLWLLDVPTNLGGQGVNMEGMCAVWEELHSCALVPPRNDGIFGPSPGPVLLSLRGEQADRFLIPLLEGELTSCFAQTEEAAGSDPRAIRTVATHIGENWLINGSKRFITAADTADFTQVVCRAVDEDGTDLGFAYFLVDSALSGYSVAGCDRTIDGEEVWEIVFDDVVLPASCLVGAPGAGLALAQEWLVRGRLAQAARAVAVGRRALEMGGQHITERETFGHKLATRQGLVFPMVDAWTSLSAARSLLYSCAQRFDDGEDVRVDSAAVKVFAVDAGIEAVDWSIQAHGGLGLTLAMPLMQWFADLRSRRITEGASEVMRDYIGRQLLRDQALDV